MDNARDALMRALERASYRHASRQMCDKNVIPKLMRDNIIHRDVRSQIYLQSVHREYLMDNEIAGAAKCYSQARNCLVTEINGILPEIKMKNPRLTATWFQTRDGTCGSYDVALMSPISGLMHAVL